MFLLFTLNIIIYIIDIDVIFMKNDCKQQYWSFYNQKTFDF